MIKEVIDQWTEYKEWVASENEPILKKHSKVIKKQWDQFNLDCKAHEARVKAADKKYDKERADEQKKLDDYDSLGWFKKMFIEDPHEEFIYCLARRRYYSPSPSLPFIYPCYGLIEVSQRGFMDWLEERQNEK